MPFPSPTSVADFLISDRSDVVVRDATPADDGFLRALFREDKSLQFAPLGLPAPMLETMLEQQFRAQRQGYAAMFPGADHFIVDQLGLPVGRLIIAALGDCRLHLVDLVLAVSARGHGIGTAVLTTLITTACAGGFQQLTLSVNVTNPGAAKLYTRLGFRFCDPGTEPTISREMTLELPADAGPRYGMDTPPNA